MEYSTNTQEPSDDPILLASEEIGRCRLCREQAWVYSECNYYDATYQTALIAWDNAVAAYNRLIVYS